MKALRINFLNDAIQNLNFNLAKKFGYSEMNSKDHFWILDSKKHPENENHAYNYKIFKEALSKMNSYESLENVEMEIAPAIEYFSSVVSKYPGSDRKSRKLKYASFYNLGILYYYLDQPEKTIEYADKLIINDFDKADGRILKEKAERLKNSLEINQIKTRHFEVITEDQTDYGVVEVNTSVENTGPFDPTQAPDYSLSFIITTANDTVKTYINMNSVNKLSSRLNGYVKDLEGKYVQRSFGAHEVDLLLLGNGEKRYAVAFAGIGDGIGEAGHKFVKRLYSSEKIGIYQHQTDEFVIKKFNNKGYSTSNPGWLLGFKKKLSKMAEDCNTVAESAKNKKYQNNVQSLIQFAKDYTNCQ